MNYYMQGNAAKAERIKAAFEELGYDISWPGGCANPNVINIGVERNGAKYVVAETSEYIKDIIKTHPDYKELHLPQERHPKFKVGDLVLFRDMLGRIEAVTEDEEGSQLYMVGGGLYAEECELRLADHRDEVRILRSPGVC